MPAQTPYRLLLALLVVLGAAPARAGDTGSFTEHSFSTTAGTLTYRLYVPPRKGPRPTALMVVLPGAGETSEVAAKRSRWNTVAQEHRFVVAYPEQNPEYNASREWDWAKASRGGRADREASLIAGITRSVVTGRRLDAGRVFVMGISAGAGMASAVAVAFPDVFRGLGIEAGCPFDNAGCAGGSVTADQSAAAVLKGMGRYRRAMPVFNEYGSVDPIAVGVSSSQVVPTWLAVDDALDDGTDNGSVDRTAAESGLVTPPPPTKPYERSLWKDARGCALAENWVVHGESHAWAGGEQTDATDTGADPLAPDATTAMWRFFSSADTLGGSKRCS